MHGSLPGCLCLLLLLLHVQGVLPHNPLVTHETDTRHLRDPSFLRGALSYRVARMLFTLQLRLRR